MVVCRLYLDIRPETSRMCRSGRINWDDPHPRDYAVTLAWSARVRFPLHYVYGMREAESIASTPLDV